MANQEVYVKSYKQDRSYDYSVTNTGSGGFPVTHNAVFNLTTTFTIEAYIQPSFISGTRCIISKTTGAGATNNTFELRVNSSGFLQFLSYDTALRTITSTVALQTYTFYHVSVVKSGGTVVIKQNGLTVASGSIGTATTNTDTLRIGDRNDLTCQFLGVIQEVRLWSVAKTQQELLASKNIKLKGTEANLVAYYPLADGSETTATDLVAGRNGTFRYGSGSGAILTQDDYIAPIFTRRYLGFSTDYTFDAITSQLNSGYGSLAFKLPRKFDAINQNDPGADLKGYELDVVSYVNETETKLFSGDVSIRDSSISGAEESISYTALSPLAQLEKIDIESDVNAPTLTYTSTDIATIMKDLIDRANSRNNRPVVSYTSTSIATTGKLVTITFANSFALDALKAVFAMTDSYWVWYIDVDRVVYLKEINFNLDHILFFEKDIVEIKRSQDATKIFNVYKFWDGASVRLKLPVASSINDYGYKARAVVDARYNTAGATELLRKTGYRNLSPNDQLAFKLIGQKAKDVKIGDTFKVLNISQTPAISDLLIVTSKVNHLDYAVITADDKELYVNRELKTLKDTQFQVSSEGIGATPYTNVS